MFHGSRTTDQGFGIQASGFLPKVGTPLASTLNPVTRITDHDPRMMMHVPLLILSLNLDSYARDHAARAIPEGDGQWSH